MAYTSRGAGDALHTAGAALVHKMLGQAAARLVLDVDRAVTPRAGPTPDLSSDIDFSIALSISPIADQRDGPGRASTRSTYATIDQSGLNPTPHTAPVDTSDSTTTAPASLVQACPLRLSPDGVNGGLICAKLRQPLATPVLQAEDPTEDSPTVSSASDATTQFRPSALAR